MTARTFGTIALSMASMTWSLAATASPPDDAPALSSLQATPPPESEPESSRDGGTPPTLFGSDVSLGGYGGLDFAYARMFGQDGAVAGARVALLVNHRLSLGVAGFGWVDPTDDGGGAGAPAARELGYGGPVIHYSFTLPDLPMSLTFGGLVGGGAIEWRPSVDESGRSQAAMHDRFFVVQPELSLDAHVTSWLRVGVTGGYRFTSGIQRGGLDGSDVNGALVGAHLQLGAF